MVAEDKGKHNGKLSKDGAEAGEHSSPKNTIRITSGAEISAEIGELQVFL